MIHKQRTLPYPSVQPCEIVLPNRVVTHWNWLTECERDDPYRIKEPIPSFFHFGTAVIDLIPSTIKRLNMRLKALDGFIDHVSHNYSLIYFKFYSAYFKCTFLSLVEILWLIVVALVWGCKMGQRTTADEHTGYSVNLCMLIACKDQYVNPIRSSRSGLSGQVYFCHYRGKQLRCSRHYILVNRACITVFSNYHLGESWSYLRISVQGLQLCSSISESR